MPRLILNGETVMKMNLRMLVFRFGVVVEIGVMKSNRDMAHNILRFLENPCGKFNFHGCYVSEVNLGD